MLFHLGHRLEDKLMWPEYTTQIGTLQVRGAVRDDPALRLAVSNKLGRAEFRPQGMPPSAILIVRRLSDPLPRRVATRGAYKRRCTEWERAVKDRLGELYRHAVHPSFRQKANEAEAIVFADEAEMFACLVFDVSRRTVKRRWWWRYFSRKISISSGISGAIRNLLGEKVVYLPAVLHHLTTGGKAECVMRSLSSGDTLVLLSAMTKAYELAELRTGRMTLGRPSSFLAVDRMRSLRHKNAAGLNSNFSEEKAPSEGQKSAPWSQWLGVSEPSANLTKEQICLWGLALMLHREPSIARSTKFQKFVIDWWNESDKRSGASIISHLLDIKGSAGSDDINANRLDGGFRESLKAPHSNYRQDPSDSAPQSIQNSVWLKSADVFETDTHLKNLQDERPQTISSDQKSESFISSSSESPEPFAPDLKAKVRPTENSAAITDTADVFDAGQEATHSSTKIRETQNVLPEFEEFVATRLGGVLYLINVMTRLDLPQSFEGEWSLASRLGAWGLLELLGRALLEDTSGIFGKDPLWVALAGLDGRRQGELPGKHFVGHEAYRIPALWFQQIKKERETLRWAAMHRRLRLWSAAGYLMLEIPRDNSGPNDQAQMELRNYLGNDAKYLLARSPFSKAPVDCPPHLQTSGCPEALLRWLAFILPYCRYRLQLAFEKDFDWNSTIARQIFACPGKLYVTSTHVDFVTDINNISILVRRAGLDLNPGWNPDLGRVVQFHFE